MPTRLTTRRARLMTLCLALGFAGAQGPAGNVDDLNARAREIADRAVSELGSGYRSDVDRQRHLIYISALDDAHLADTKALLSSFHDGFRKTLGASTLPWNVTIILPTVGDFPKLVEDPRYSGMYFTRGRKVVSLDRDEVLLHEFTHALHDADIGGGRHPVWVVEGLATLFQSCDITGSGLAPYVDLSVVTVQEAIYRKRTIPLERLINMTPEAFAENGALAYAQVHYLMYYLHDRDRLKGFYKRLKDNYRDDPDGVASLGHALSSNIPDIDLRWQEWVLTLKPRDGLRLKRVAMLGVELSDHEKGAEVTAIDRDGAAKRAALIRIGDVIVGFNGQPVGSADDLYAALDACRAMQTVEINLLRNGRTLIVRQTLGAPVRRN